MKTTIKILQSALIALMLVLVSCHDFLDQKPKGRDIARTIEHFDGMVASTQTISFTFNTITPGGSTVTNGVPHWVFMTDEIITDADAFARMTTAEQNAFRWQADVFNLDDQPMLFGGMYQQIYIHNAVINGVMDAIDGTPDQKRRIMAEARVSRAFNYMMLVQFFGRPFNPATASTDLAVPLVLEASTGLTDFRRATVQEIYDFVIRELEESVHDLTLYTISRQRVSRFAGFNILGRALMLVHEYERAAEAFAEAYLLRDRTTIPLELFDYRVMMPTWQSNEMMWSMGMGFPNNFVSTENGLTRQVMTGLGGALGGGARVFVKPEFMELFVEGDLRRELFTLGTAYSNYRRNFRTTHNEGVDLPNFYLNYAETLARTGETTKARELVEHLRRHRFADNYDYSIPSNITAQGDLIRFIVEERLREYMKTGHRWFDMRRLWNDPLFRDDLRAHSTHTDGVNTWTLTEDRLVFRIPPSVMVHNPGWTNNP
ncbi:MAG: RagB/SusD family nutrient uptake outer membrane protein [Bacteroidales bacterium]|nr:RagB/SusD family nutrient uptake outer membrane protein [Bacteroidales bacterium]